MPNFTAMAEARKRAKAIYIPQFIIPILYRDTPYTCTDPCPFCGEEHFHGDTDGHRALHCELCPEYDGVAGKKNVVFLTASGILLRSEDGYYIKSRNLD